MNPIERLDQSARQVVEAAHHQAASLGDQVVMTEHLLLALASADNDTASLLQDAGVSAAALRQAVAPHSGRRPGHETLLATLGIDLAEVRRQAEETFGAEGVARAVARVRPPRPRRPLRRWISCSNPLPTPRRDSPLTGEALETIPRVNGILKRATRDAQPNPATATHLLLALVTGNEPAGELLTELGVNLHALAASTRRRLDDHDGAGGRRAG